MQVRAALTFCLALVLFGNGWAAESPDGTRQGKHLGPYFSPGYVSYREDLIVPLAFHGPELFLGAEYAQQTANQLFHFRVRFGIGHMRNRYSHEAWVLSLDARGSWMKRLARHRRYGDFSGGFCAPLQLNNLFFESWDDAHLYWLTSYAAGVAAAWLKHMSAKNSIHVRMEVPLFGWVSRPPAYRYSKQEPLDHWTYQFSEPNRSLHFETLDSYQNVFVQMVFTRQTGKSLLDLGYEFQYIHCNRPEDIRGASHSVFISYLWSVGK